MIELINDGLKFSFPEVHEYASCVIRFQRTLRIPDDGSDYPLPPGLGRFPLRHIDDFGSRVPASWAERGGVMFPMYQSEAMWIHFEGHYPFAVKIATGKINAVSGKLWRDKLNRNPQDYVVAPRQPWLDGYCVEEGVIRQFVAMPLGTGVTAEEQITGEAEYGGLQIIAYPLTAVAYDQMVAAAKKFDVSGIRFCRSKPMGLAPGGRMKQEIYRDTHDPVDWDLEHSSRCFVHICNSMAWRGITGECPPTKMPTAKEYTRAGLPWFDYYDDDSGALKGSGILSQLKSVAQWGKTKKGALLPENETAKPAQVVNLVPGKQLGQVVREWSDGSLGGG